MVDMMAMSVLLVVLFVLSGIFSGSETAYTTLSAAQLHQLSESGRAGRRVWRMCRHTNRLIVAILIGNNLANIGLSVVATAMLVAWVSDAGGEPGAHLWKLTLVLTVLVLILSEITPKVLARSRPQLVARLLSLPLRTWELVMWVPARLLEGVARGVRYVIGMPGEQTAEQKGQRELTALIDMGRSLGLLGEKDHEFMHRILRRSRTRSSNGIQERPDVLQKLFLREG